VEGINWAGRGWTSGWEVGGGETEGVMGGGEGGGRLGELGRRKWGWGIESEGRKRGGGGEVEKGG